MAGAMASSSTKEEEEEEEDVHICASCTFQSEFPWLSVFLPFQI
jgi:hypothetical protein